MISLVLFTALQAPVQPGSQPGAGAPLTNASLKTNGLGNERLLTNLFLGNFAEVNLKRSDVLFWTLYGDYLMAYGRRCDAYLPKNKVELKETYCSQEGTSIDRFGNRTSNGTCVTYSTRGTGVYADPTLVAAEDQFQNASGQETFQDIFRSMAAPNPLGTALSTLGATQAMKSDMDSLVRINACDSQGLKRFQDNLMLFALNKTPISMPGAAAPVASGPRPAGPANVTDQNFTRLVDDLILDQSRTWVMNRYVPGSTSNVVVSSRDASGKPLKISARYLFNGRNSGEVTVDFSNGVPACLYFFDAPSSCKTASPRVVAAYSSGAYGSASGTSPSAVPQPGPAAPQLQTAPGAPADGAARRVLPAPASAPPAPTARPAASQEPASAPTPAAPAAPALTAEQQRQQRVAEAEKRRQKITACAAAFQQGLKDHPEASVELTKTYTACIQAK
jgi:hypothetical protein